MPEQSTTPDLVELAAQALEAGSRHDLDAVTFEDHTIEQEETVDLGHGVLFAKVREVGRFAGSDGRVEQHRGWVTVWVGSKIVHYAVYDDIDEARAAAERLAQERADG